MDKIQIVYRNIKDLKPYKKNAKKHPKEQVKQIAESIKEFGFTQPVIIDANDCVVAGHGRILGAKKAGLKQVPTVMLEDLTEEQIKAYRLVDNKTNESSWDNVLLQEELKELQESLQMDLFGFDLGVSMEEEEKRYSMKTEIPHYIPQGLNVTLENLVDKTKTNELLKKIKDSNVSDEEKAFLKLATYRHLRFDYKNIAEYYANASEEMQELMEDSALVIIDVNDAMEKGYVQLTDRLMELVGNEEE